MASGTSTTAVLRITAPAFCASSSPQSSETVCRCLTISNMISLRCCCVLKRHSPPSNARRAAPMARRASARVPAGARAITSSVDGLIAYAVARSPLPPPVAMPIAASLASVAAVLGWFRVAGRPALDWAVYACLYAVRPRGGRFVVDVTSARVPATTRHRPVMRLRALSPRAPWAHPAAAPDADIIPLRPRGGWAGMARPLAVGDATSPATRPLRIGGAHRITFFSLKGGTGRTMLAVELACALASTSRARRDGAEPLRVALLDLDVRCASVAVRLGLAHAGLMEFALS